MLNLNEIIRELKAYDGPQIKLMEVCGTHTNSIFKHGIRSLISPKIKLISGPGCPVCVTPAAYIDAAIALAKKADHVLLTFGDMIKVPGTEASLAEAKGEGANVEIMYSPLEALEKAKKNTDKIYVIAAVGFETTVPPYALLLEKIIQQDVKNIKFLTALKTIVPALEWVCSSEPDIDGFICPGHASVIVGSIAYEPLAERFNKPFVVAGFEAEHVLTVIYDLVRQIQTHKGVVHNLYNNVVKDEGNVAARALIARYFESGEAAWRGLGKIDKSGLYLKAEYQQYDAGSYNLDRDEKKDAKCACGAVIIGKISPDECPLFGKVCTPSMPMGPCMVSSEGACGIYYKNVR